MLKSYKLSLLCKCTTLVAKCAQTLTFYKVYVTITKYHNPLCIITKVGERERERERERGLVTHPYIDVHLLAGRCSDVELPSTMTNSNKFGAAGALV